MSLHAKPHIPGFVRGSCYALYIKFHSFVIFILNPALHGGGVLEGWGYGGRGRCWILKGNRTKAASQAIAMEIEYKLYALQFLTRFLVLSGTSEIR